MNSADLRPDELDQRLMELVYDLLTPEEASALRARVTSEPDVARAYAKARQHADLLATAARLEHPPIGMKAPIGDGASPANADGTRAPAASAAERMAESATTSAAAAGDASPAAATPARRARREVAPAAGAPSRVVPAIIILASLVLVGFLGYSYVRPDSAIHRLAVASAEQEIAARHMRVVVSGPASITRGATSIFHVTSSLIDGRAIPAEVEYTVYSPKGEPLLERTEATDGAGRLRIELPPHLGLAANSRLEVLATAGDMRQRYKLRLAVDEPRYATQLSLDKPLYRPGEIAYYRSLTLSRFRLAADRELPVHFEILDPAGGTVAGSQAEGYTERGVGSGAFAIPAGLAGGKYTLVARSLDGAFPEERRDFFIRSYRLPRLKKELELTRDSYGPGDEVTADFAAARAEGGAAAGAKLSITATVDGHTVHAAAAEADRDGACRVTFRLPETIERGAASLAVIVDDGGTRETIAKTIPINLGKVEVDFYPEGGDLVAHVTGRVYFHAYDPLGEPVHIAGRIVDSKGLEAAALETQHEGRGVFAFTPRQGERYWLEVTQPPGVASRPALPETNEAAQVVLDTGPGVFAAEAPLELVVMATKPALPLAVSAVCRGVEVGQREFVVAQPDRKGDSIRTSIALPLAPEADGVIRVTVYDYGQKPPRPVAERLVWRQPKRRLDVHLADASESYSPGDKVRLSLVVTDETGEPVPAALGVAVVDDALLNLADDKSATMPAHYRLATEIENPADLEDVNFYLSGDPKAARSLDLLLGTQGWRRFVETSAAEAAAKAEAGADIPPAEAGERPNEAEAPADRVEAEKAEERRKNIERLLALHGADAPPVVLDNYSRVEADYAMALAAFQGQRQETIRRTGALATWGAGILLIVLVLAALARAARSPVVWVPALSAATAALILGGLWTSARVDSTGELAMGPTRGYYLYDDYAGLDAVKEVAVALHKLAPEEADLFRLEELKGLAIQYLPAAGKEEAQELFKRNLNADGEVANDLALNKEVELAAIIKDRLALEADLDLGRFLELKDLDGKYREAPPGRRLADLQSRLRRAAEAGEVAQLRELAERYEKALEEVRFPIRQYAHKRAPAKAGPDGQPGPREDFTETVYWHPLLVADASGRATLEFDLCDSVTMFRVRADAHGAARIGGGEGEIVSRIPFSLEPKLPLEVNAGDRIDLPLAVNNDTRADLPVVVNFSSGELVELAGPAERTLRLAAGERSREYFSLAVTGDVGEERLTFRGRAGTLTDAIERRLKVVPPGFPVARSFSGRIDGPQQLALQLPDEWVPGSLEVTLQALPSALADLATGVDSILREPSGCFEQTSSSNYPNVMALQYMREHDVADPAFVRRAKDLLQKGYARLVGFECPQKGYEWFGGDPGHEALTAYGLLEFRDMSQVWDVDQAMVKRTADWLLARRDGQGGFTRNPRALDSFGGAPKEITDAYIVWALCEAGQPGIDAELDKAIETARASSDPYLVALAANAALAAGRKAAGEELLEKLAGHQKEDGRLVGTQGSITRSGGISLEVETTALAAMAWLRSPAAAPRAHRAVEWLTRNRQGGGFGSTQATVLGLMALTRHAQANRKTTNDGALVVARGGEELGRRPFEAGEKQAIVLDGLAAHLTPGKNELSITLSGENEMPYALDISYRTRQPVSDENCPVRLATSLARPRVKAGETVGLSVALENVSGQGQPMTIAIVGLPAGLEARADQLEELRKAGRFDYYETQARELIFYWRSLSPETAGETKVAFDLELVAEIPGRYTGPASRAYLYYTAEQKQWNAPLTIEIERE
jgi:hypothetical protein